jgi:hypothetical protein
MLLAYRIDGTDHQRVEAIGGSLIAEVDDLVAICDEHMAYAGRNHLPFLIQPYKMVRAQLLNCIEIVNPQSSSEDDTLIRMMKALQALRGTRHEIVPLSLVGLNAEEDFQWLLDLAETGHLRARRRSGRCHQPPLLRTGGPVCDPR